MTNNKPYFLFPKSQKLSSSTPLSQSHAFRNPLLTQAHRGVEYSTLDPITVSMNGSLDHYHHQHHPQHRLTIEDFSDKSQGNGFGEGLRTFDAFRV